MGQWRLFAGYCCLALPILILLSACEEDSPTDCPSFNVGAVEGRVICAGKGVSVVIGARALEGHQADEIVATTHSDSTGYFNLGLPSGLYRLETNPSGYFHSSSSQPDTVRLGSQLIQHDLLRGALHFQLMLPPELEGLQLYLEVESDQWQDSYGFGVVEDGVLDVSFPLLQLGSYVAKLKGGRSFGAVGSFLLPGTQVESEADHLEVGWEEPLTYSLDLTERYSWVEGSVSGSWQVLDGAAPMVSMQHELGRDVGRVRCEEDGSFGFHSLLEQRVRFRVSVGNQDRWIGGEEIHEARLFTITPGQDLLGLDYVESGFRVQLHFPGSLDQQDFEVEIFEDDGSLLRTRDYYREADFTIHNLETGRYLVRVSGQKNNLPWAPQWYGFAEAEAVPKPIDLGEGVGLELEMSLFEGGTISGQGLNPDGTTPGSRYCFLLDGDGEQTPHPVRHLDGAFSFQGLNDGDYYLGFPIQAGVTWWYPGTWNQEEAQELTISNHSSHTGIVMGIPEPDWQVAP